MSDYVMVRTARRVNTWWSHVGFSSGFPSWLPLIGGVPPNLFADFTSEGTSNHYWYGNTTYGSFAAWLTGITGTFSRGSSGTYINQSGLLATASTNVMRFEYNAVSRLPVGALLETTSTNSALQSNNFSVTWTDTEASQVQNVTGPDGVASSAWTVTDTNVNNLHVILQSVTVSSSTIYTFSCYVKYTNHQYVGLRQFDGSATFPWVIFDVLNGVITNAEAGSSGIITPLANGWYRLAHTYTANANGTGNVIVGFANSSTYSGAAYVGTGTDTFLVYGAQWEAFPTVSSYMATTTVPVARSADVLTWVPSTVASNGAAFLKWSASLNFVNDHLLGETAINEPFFFRSSATRISAFDGGSVTGPASSLTGLNDKAAMTWDVAGNRKAITSNGGTPGSAALVTGWDLIADGAIVRLGGDFVALFVTGDFAQVGFWNLTATDAQLQALTT